MLRELSQLWQGPILGMMQASTGFEGTPLFDNVDWMIFGCGALLVAIRIGFFFLRLRKSR